MVSISPAFGQADLTNCERELIHLAGSVQPHGVMLVFNEAGWTVEQVSANAAEVFGVALDDLLGKSIEVLGGNLLDRVRSLAAAATLADPEPLLA